MTLEKQPLNIDRTLLLAFLRSNTDLYEKNLESDFLDVLTDFIDNLPQEDTYQKTTVPNVLLYETGYKEGYQKGRGEVKEKINVIRKKYYDYSERYIEVDANEILDDLYTLLSPTDTK